jgi:hypothetical protein
MSSKQILRALLDDAARHAKHKERRLVATVAVAVLCLLILLSALVLSLIGPGAGAWLLRIGIIAFVILGASFIRRRSPTRVTDIIALNSAGHASAVDTAASLVAWPREPKRAVVPSSSLAQAHIEETTAALESSGFLAKIDRFYAPKEKNASRLAAASLLTLLVAIVLAGAPFRSLFYAFFAQQDAEVSDVPLIGDLALTLRYPSYTGLAPKELRGGDGTIRALKGTSVVFKASAERSVRSAELRIGDDRLTERVVPLSVEHGKELSGELVVERNERYRVVLKPTFGSDLKERKGHLIVADEDKFPTVEIRDPSQDMELKDTGRLLIAYSADDDFAVSELVLEYRTGAQAPVRVTLPPTPQKTRIKNDYAFDLSPLALKAGDVVTIVLEAKDNDTVSGPKIARSRERRITVFSSDQHRRELLQRLRLIVDKMVDQLADELENPLTLQGDPANYAQKALPADDRGLALSAELSEIGSGLKESEGNQPKFSLSSQRTADELRATYTKKRAIDQTIQKARAGSVPVLQGQSVYAQAVELLERSVIYFEDLRALAAIEEMKAQAKELQTAHAELKQLLEQYKQSGDENLRRALETEIASLKQKIGEIMQKMAELRRGLPQEFLNREALERRAMDNIFDRMDQMLAENRLDDLGAELERLQAQMQNDERRRRRVWRRALFRAAQGAARIWLQSRRGGSRAKRRARPNARSRAEVQRGRSKEARAKARRARETVARGPRHGTAQFRQNRRA